MNINWNYMREKLTAYSETIVTDNFTGAVSTTMPRTFLIGNGDIALISAGKGDKKEFLISKGDFWSFGNGKTDDPMGMNPNKLTSITFGGITFGGFDEGKFTETLDIGYGTLTTKKRGIVLETVCHQEKNAVIMKLSADRDVDLDIKLWAKGDVPQYPAAVYEKDGCVCVSRKTANSAPDDEGSWTSVVVASMVSDGEMRYVGCGENYAQYSIKLYSDRDSYIILAIGGGGKTLDNKGNAKSPTPEDEIKEIFGGIKSHDDLIAGVFYDELWWQEYWLRSYVHLSDAQLEKYYYGSMYLLACFARKGKRPNGLYGNFVTTDNPKWQNDFHLNYNFIAPFYGAYSSNRHDFAEPLSLPLLEFVPEGIRRAANDLDKVSKGYIKGGKAGKIRFKGRKELRRGMQNAVLFPVGIGPYGYAAWNERGGYLSQMYDAAFTASCITAYYSFTLDGEYLKKHEELLVLIVNFYLGWSEKEVLENGNYRYNVWSGAHEDTFEMNTPGAIGAIKSVLKCLLLGVERGDIAGTDENVSVWKDFVTHLAQYPIRTYTLKKRFKKVFEKPIVLMGERGLEISVGQTIALEFIHPIYDIDFFSAPNLLEASKNLVALHKLIDPKVYEQINAFPKNFTHAIMCGVAAENVVDEFKKVLDKQFCYNYSVDDGNVHGIEKCGATEFIHAMLLMSSGDTVKVFPNAPKGKSLQFSNLRARGAFTVSSARLSDGRIEYVEIVSEKITQIRLVNPFAKPIVTDSDGLTIDFSIQKVQNIDILVFVAKLNTAYVIKESKMR